MDRVTYFDGGKWRLQCGGVEYSGDFADRLAAYEDTGMTPEEIRAADVAEVRRGRWEYEPQTINTLSRLKCSECGWWTLDPSVDGAYHYCPNCGAEMEDPEVQANSPLLKPCPFCGGKAEFARRSIKTNGSWCDAVYVRCANCDARSNRVLCTRLHKNGSEYSEAQEAWNRRADYD